MKKMIAILVVLMLASIGTAFAADGTKTNTAGQPLTLSGKEISASPKVNLSYQVLDGNTFYIIGSYHGGGDTLYGSSSTVTKIYKYTWLSTDTKGFTKLPATKVNAQSEAQWTGAGFSY